MSVASETMIHVINRRPRIASEPAVIDQYAVILEVILSEKVLV